MPIPMHETEARNLTTFTALMWALAHPGRPHTLPETGLAAFVAVGDALIDLETSYFTPHADLARQFACTSARALPADRALYQFYPELRSADLDHLRHAPIGSYAYPDAAATLVIGCRFGRGMTLRLRGPGIQHTTDLAINNLPEAWWSLRERVGQYPLGWDVFLIDGEQVIGVPRTTHVEVC